MILSLIFLLISFILLYIAYKQFTKIKKLLETGITTTATIIDVHKTESKSTDMDGYTTISTGYTPEVEFKTETGETVTYTSPISTSNKNKWKVGDQIEVIYDPDDKKNIKINQKLQLYFIPGILGSIGALFLIISIVSLLS